MQKQEKLLYYIVGKRLKIRNKIIAKAYLGIAKSLGGFAVREFESLSLRHFVNISDIRKNLISLFCFLKLYDVKYFGNTISRDTS